MRKINGTIVGIVLALAVPMAFAIWNVQAAQAPVAAPAQAPAPVLAPQQLKPEVRAALRDAQWAAAKLLIDMKNLETQHQQMQRQFDAAQAELNQKLANALTLSGIEKDKYDLNGDTLEVFVKPAPAASEAAKPAAKDKKP